MALSVASEQLWKHWLRIIMLRWGVNIAARGFDPFAIKNTLAVVVPNKVDQLFWQKVASRTNEGEWREEQTDEHSILQRRWR